VVQKIGKHLVAVAVAILALPLGVTAALAGNGTTHEVVENVAFSIPAGQCPQLFPTLSVEGEGIARLRGHVRQDASGLYHLQTGATITGRAEDSEGGSYRFNYHNTFNFTSLDLVAPIELHVTDHFNLVGNGAANQIQAFFAFSVRLNPDGTVSVRLNEHGDPLDFSTFTPICDPL
jgi:hypothetical protein